MTMKAPAGSAALEWTSLPPDRVVRFASCVVVRVAAAPDGGHWLELESGAVVLAPAGELAV